MSLFQRMKAEWEKQPLTVIIGFCSIIIAIYFGSNSQFSLPYIAGMGNQKGSNNVLSQTSIPLFFSITPLAAWVSGKIFRKSFFSGFTLSLLIASSIITIFIGIERFAIFSDATIERSHIESSLADILYWATFLIFMGICFHPMIYRLLEVNPITSKELDGKIEKEGGITFGEIIILVGLWGMILSSAQTKILNHYAVGFDIKQKISPERSSSNLQMHN